MQWLFTIQYDMHIGYSVIGISHRLCYIWLHEFIKSKVPDFFSGL